MVYNIMFGLGKEAPVEYATKYYKDMDGAEVDNTVIGEIVTQSIVGNLDKQIIIGSITQDIDGVVTTNTLIDNINCNG